MRYLSRHCLIVLLLLTTFIVALDPVHPATTAAFGSFENSAFRVRWPDRWQEVRRTETNIVLYDGITEIQMVAVEDSQSPQTSVGQIANDWFTSVLTNVENATEVPGLATADDVRASTVYTYQYRASPASLIPYAAYFESRRIAPNVLLWIVVDTEWGAFNADSGYFADVLKSLEISGTPTDGEVSQTFSVPGWRISVPAASLTESSPTLGLSQQPGQLWLIVLADVVNWTNSESAFDTSTAQIVAEDGQRLVPSPLHSQSVALSLRLQSITGTDVAVPPGHSIRLPLVYQVPAGISDLVLAVGDEQLPLNDTLVLELAASTLPPEQLAPVLQEATITGLVGSSRIQLQRVDGTVIDAPLTGIALPDFRDCGGREAWTDALSLVGQRVLLESDQGILGVDHLWLWLDGHDGRHLLNQVLVERGHATVTALPETSRFASWLNHTETTASENQVGRWQSCRSSAVSPIASPLLGSVTFDVEAGVNPADAELVREGITLAERQFAVLFGQKLGRPLTVVVRSGEADRGETSGIYQADTVQIFTGSVGWLARSEIERLKIVVHEYAHYFLDPAPLGRARPVWLEEGLAEHLAWSVLDHAQLANESEILAYQALHVRIWPPGSDLCAISPGSISGIAYPLAHLGAALLTERAPMRAIAAYRQAMVDGTLHDDAFTAAFGIDEQSFCAESMDRIWDLAAGPAKPGEFYLRESEVLPGQVVIDAPPPLAAGTQVLFDARTADSAHCTWLLSGQIMTSLTRTVMADGDGDIFWLVTIPQTAQPSPATLSVTCGVATDQIALQIGD